MDIQTFASGSSGNCSLITLDNTYILLDAGISMRRISQGLAVRGITPDKLGGVLITHEHTDHIKGLKMMIKHWNTMIYTTAGTAQELYRMMPETYGRIIEITPQRTFGIGEAEITAVRTPHDAAESVGFVLNDTVSGSKLSYFTDMGKITREIVDAAEGSDVVLLEANHDIEMLKNGQYPYHLKTRILSDRGHLSNERCGAFAAYLAENGTKNILLAHLSRENNRPEAAYNTVAEALAVKAVGGKVKLYVAPVDIAGELCLC